MAIIYKCRIKYCAVNLIVNKNNLKILRNGKTNRKYKKSTYVTNNIE